MEFKGTPAPWKIQKIESEIASYFDITSDSIIRSGYMPILDIESAGRETAHANANLIAAAPELLDALIELTESAKEAIDGLGDLADAIDTAKAAIAKALGQQ